MAAITRRGLMFVLSSPSGAGKTTLSKLLLASDANIYLSISCTTRQKRPSETPDVDYYFLDEQLFFEKQKKDEFLETAFVFGSYYGTPRAPVEHALHEGRDVLFDIDWQGAQQLAEAARSNLVSVFILPPSEEALTLRLQGRSDDSDEVVRYRMSKAANEMSHWSEYDYVIVNDNLQHSLQDLQAILRAERQRRSRLVGLSQFVRGLTQDRPS